MAAPQTKQYGVTPPISSAIPTKQELEANDALTAELKRQDNFEGQAETEKRYSPQSCEFKSSVLTKRQEISIAADPENHNGIRQAGEQEEEPAAGFGRQCWREDLHLR